MGRHYCCRHPSHLVYRDCPIEMEHRRQLRVRSSGGLGGGVFDFALILLVVIVAAIVLALWALVSGLTALYRVVTR